MPRRILSGTAVMLALAAGATSAATRGLLLGPASTAKTRAFKAYYDGHKDTFLVTDVSSKAQATTLKANYSAAIGRVKRAPAHDFVRGAAAQGRRAVVGSERRACRT